MDNAPVITLTAEQRLQLLMAGIRDYAIYLLDPNGMVSSWNTGAERFKGYLPDEIIGQSFARFYTPEDQAAGLPQRGLAKASAEGKFEAEGWRVRKDGTRFWASVVIDAIHDDDGVLLGFAKITRDITEQYQARQALRDSQEALQRANAALFQSQKMQAIGQLTGGIAHDFNNLLSVLSSGLDVLVLSPDARDDARLMDTMRRAVQRGSTLTQQLLAFARKQPLRPETCDINAMVAGFESVLRRAVPSTIEFDIELGRDVGAVSVDAQRFEAAILNLVVNSRDAMAEGGMLLLKTEAVDLPAGAAGTLPPGRYAQLRVVDTGAGMGEDVLARAFEPFFTTKDVGRGTGLGLSQVYGFITQSGGDVQLSSEPGQGTAVVITLPLVDGDAVAPARDADLERVLVVEDEPELLELAASLFRSIGYDVLTANNGADAARILDRESDIDILFSDVVMPQMSGVELARWAREHHPDVRIVLTSGYPAPALEEEHAEIGSYPFLHKPYRLAELAKVLRSV